MRYPFNIHLRTVDGILVASACLYGLFAAITGIGFGDASSGRYEVIRGTDARIIGFLFVSAAISYLAWIDWRANTSWKAKVVMFAALGSFFAGATAYLVRAFA